MHLANYRAAFDLPCRARIVPADRVAITYERRDRLSELPGLLAAGAGFAVIDLQAYRVHLENDRLPFCGNFIRYFAAEAAPDIVRLTAITAVRTRPIAPISPNGRAYTIGHIDCPSAAFTA